MTYAVMLNSEREKEIKKGEAMTKRCAWNLLTEIDTRFVAKPNFKELLIIDYMNELEILRSKARSIVKLCMVNPIYDIHGCLYIGIGSNITDFVTLNINPFIMKWHSDFKFWWKKNLKSPFLQSQKKYPNYLLLIQDLELLDSKLHHYKFETLYMYYIKDYVID